jgi:NADH-quinone oxidoreductase subunit F
MTPSPQPGACCDSHYRNIACRRTALEREIDLIERLGVKFIFNTRIGFDIPLNDLDDRFDAVFITIGTWKESWVYQPGTELKGVYPALMFLEATARGEEMPLGPKVAIIGGGNAAIDSARTALRKGAEVTVFYRRERKDMPAIEEETQAAKDEGAKFVFLAAPHRVIGDAAGKVKSIEIVKTRLGEYDASGRRKPISTDDIRRYECDSIIFAVGESVDLDFARASGLSLKESGTIEVNRFTSGNQPSTVLRRRGRGYGRIERVERDGLWQTGGSQY